MSTAKAPAAPRGQICKKKSKCLSLYMEPRLGQR